MIGGGVAFAVWALLLASNAAVLFLFDVDAESYALLWGASGAVMLTALVLFLLGRQGYAPDGDDERSRPVPDLSMPAAALGLALALLALSAEAGLWLTLIAAGLAVWSAARLVREVRCEWRDRRA